MTYDVRIERAAQKEIAQLAEDKRVRVLVAVRALATNPRPDGCKKLKGELAGWYRVRVGDVRVIYSVEDRVRIVSVSSVGKRGDIY